MAFNFYGTFTTGQFSKFRDFSKLQEQDLKRRISWLKSELLRVGIFNTQYDPETNRPVRFSVAPATSYAAKLMLAYKILGGMPEHEMLLRTRDKPVYKVTGVPLSNDPQNPDSGYSSEFSNGRNQRSNQRFDRDLGVKVNKIKKWQLEIIKRKRESLEFKIKKALDYSDQLSEEIVMLQNMVNDESRSLDSLVTDAKVLMFVAGAQTVLDDVLDFWGIKIGKKVDPTVPGDLDSAEAKGSIK